LAQMTDATRPGAVGGVYNINQGTPQLNLPIGGAVPHDLIKPCNGSEPVALRTQKFDCLVASPADRFVNSRPGTGQPSWITGPTVFFDRREDRWVKAWTVDVAQMIGPTSDSIFYLYDSVLMVPDRGKRLDTVIDAFKLVNASPLRHNVSIASGNPIYLDGNFNAASPGSTCKPVDYQGTVPDSEKYCNAMIASDAFTMLSPSWDNNNYAAQGMNGTFEQSFFNANWLTGADAETISGYTDVASAGMKMTLNAAILTGNKPTDSIYLPPLATDNTEPYFEAHYEGGWHNTIRFLENLSADTVRFRGSFVCMWNETTQGLRMRADSVIWSTRFFKPPVRNWGYDPRFNDINNMPPGTPFLSTGVYYNWLQTQ